MTAPLSGRVTPPDDLRPAIDALTPEGRQRLADLTEKNGGFIKPWMIAQAADYERGERG